jgi:hypothetical protein
MTSPSPDSLEGLIEELRTRAESYRMGGPSSEHTAALLDRAAYALASLPRAAALPDREAVEVLHDALRSIRVTSQARIAPSEACDLIYDLAGDALERADDILALFQKDQGPSVAEDTDQLFEIGCRVRLRDADMDGELREFNADVTGALIAWDTGDEVWKNLRNLVVAPSPIPPAGGAG